MKCFVYLAVTIWLLVTATAFCAPTPIALKKSPQRIISLSPGITEMLFALGLGNRIVGDTVYCDYPPAAKRIAKIGDSTANMERIIALKPDLIVADGIANRSALPRLQQLHLPVFVVRPNTLAAVESTIRQLGQITNTNARAKVILAQMHAKEIWAQTIVTKDRAHHPKVLIVVGVAPLWTAGRNTFLDNLVTRAGGINAAGSVENYVPYSKEQVLANPPDVILGDGQALAAFRADPVFKTLLAVRQGHLLSYTDENIATRPGPRLADGLVQLTRWLHPGVK